MKRGVDDCMEQDRTAIFAVVEELNVEDLDAYCRQPRESFFKRFKSKLKGKRPLPIVTTRRNLQQAINKYQGNAEITKMLILASDRIRNISIRVPRKLGIKALTILRAGAVANMNENSQQSLLITGRSTFNGVRFDEWQGKDRKSSRLVLGSNVRIKVNVNGRSSWTQACRNNNGQSTHLAAAKKYVEESSQHARSSGQGWDDWRGIVSAVLGVAVGAGKFALEMKAAAAGIFVQYKFGAFAFTAGAGSVSASTVITALGTGTLLGAGAAAVVYFIPWDELNTFVQNFIRNFWSGIVGLWAAFRDWVASFFSAPQRRHMEFPSTFDFVD